MFAIIETGGKQYRVQQGSCLQIEKLDTEAGSEVTFDKVLLVKQGDSTTIGAPYVDKARVEAKVIDQVRGKKIRIIKFKRRKHHMRTAGHRQYLTNVEVTAIHKEA